MGEVECNLLERKRAARQEWTHAIIAVVVICIAIALTIAFVNPAVALATKSVIYALGGGTGFFVTAAGFLAGAAVGSVMGYGVGIVGGAIGAAMAQGINGGWDYKSGKQLGETSAAIGGFIGGFFENRDVSDGKTETVKTEGHKEEYLFNKKGQSLWQDGQRQKLVSKYVIKAEQVNTWPRISSTSYAVRWNNEIGLDKFWLKDVFAGNVTQDQMTKAYGRTQPQPQ